MNKKTFVAIIIVGTIASGVLAYQYWWMPKENFSKQEEENLEAAYSAARDAARIANLLSIRPALEMYYEDNGQYPVSKGVEKTNDEFSVLYKSLQPYFADIYIEIPIDPKDPEFYYTYESDDKAYELVARLENLKNKDCIIEQGICYYKCNQNACGKEFKGLEMETKEGELKEETKDETTDWKTYRNKYLNFLFKYPQDWVVANDSLPKIPKKTVSRENLKITNALAIERPNLVLWVNPEGFGVIPPDIIYKLAPTEKMGIEIIDRIVIGQSEENLNIDDQIVIFGETFKLGTNTYAFHFIFKKDGMDYETVFKQILSTFRFIVREATKEEKSESVLKGTGCGLHEIGVVDQILLLPKKETKN